VSIAGTIYALGAMARGWRWRKRLSHVRAHDAQDIQQQALPLLLDHARSHVPYYREMRLPSSDLRAFPILSRTTLRTEFERLKSDDLAHRHWRKASTGGSTGEPVQVILDRDFLAWAHATDMYALQTLCGLSPYEYLSHRRAAIWHQRQRSMPVHPSTRLAGRLLRQLIFLEPYEALSQQKLDEHVRRLNEHRPAVILAFAGTAFQIAKYVLAKNLPMHRPRLIVASAEMLYPTMRETIRQAFGCPVLERYGAAETGRVAWECSHGKLHVFSFSHVIEVLDSNDRPVRPGEVGRIVITPLHNLAMPLIRYDIGDLARVSAQPCPCGSPLPTWDEMTGRAIHHFVRADGDIVFGGNFIAMFYEYNWILQFYVLQEAVDRIVIRFKRTPGQDIPGRDLDTMTGAVRRVLGEHCAVFWEETDSIPLSPTGKHLHTRSLVWEERMARAESERGIG
jgi:phenylacetate-CoA ligase